ncbi:MAG TPA: hypothetical protein VF525_17320 [Pyrinomonadaceae bacterium]
MCLRPAKADSPNLHWSLLRRHHHMLYPGNPEQAVQAQPAITSREG